MQPLQRITGGLDKRLRRRERMSKWPKVLPPLDVESQQINDDFMRYWHEVFSTKLRFVDRWNHSYVVRHAPLAFKRTLDIGAGLGEHLAWERLTREQESEYVAVELRENMARRIRARFPCVTVITADVQEQLCLPSNHFDRVVAVHVLEHLPNLPAALREIYRVCTADATVSVVIPCEGSVATSLARRLSAQRLYEKRYGRPYEVFIRREHLNRPDEILEELIQFFEMRHRSFLPTLLPVAWCNLFIGMTLHPRK
jgi:ubiquinone/menaquinone biosynthesis C-methylase UbiE